MSGSNPEYKRLLYGEGFWPICDPEAENVVPPGAGNTGPMRSACAIDVIDNSSPSASASVRESRVMAAPFRSRRAVRLHLSEHSTHATRRDRPPFRVCLSRKGIHQTGDDLPERASVDCACVRDESSGRTWRGGEMTHDLLAIRAIDLGCVRTSE